MQADKSWRRYSRWALTTLVFIYLVILAGSIVRATGSGMGCPDWPMCYGELIPPISEEQLPHDYKQKYAVEGHPVEFNAVQTWIEYLNRLFGVLVGFAALIQFAYSLKFFRTRPLFPALGFVLVLLLGVEGFLGAKVVASNLKPLMVTVHMAVAQFISGLGIWLYLAARRQRTELRSPWPSPVKFSWLTGTIGLLTLALTFLQFFLGTRVREEVDAMNLGLSRDPAVTWLDPLGGPFWVHRLSSIALAAIFLLFFALCFGKRKDNPAAYRHLVWLLILMGLNIAVGFILIGFGIPAWAQPSHLILATWLFGLELAYVFRFVTPVQGPQEPARP